MEETLLKAFRTRVAEDVAVEVNWEETKKLQEMPKYKNFNKWLDDNGAKRDSIEYPACFGPDGGLIGIAAKRDIGIQEAYIYVPSNLVICEEKFRQDPDIGHILEENTEIFVDHYFGEHLVLIFFICYEIGKGEKSFWAPYFQTAERCDMLASWPVEDLDELEDELLRTQCGEEMADIKETWQTLFTVVAEYADILDLDQFTFQKFLQAYNIVVTRCFGYSLPQTVIVPLADCVNHHNVDGQYELYHSRLHNVSEKDFEQVGTEEKHYYTHSRRRINFQKHFSKASHNSDINYPLKSRDYVKVAQNREKYLKLTPKKFLETPEYKDKEIWEMAHIDSSEAEDDETTSSDEGESEEEDEVAFSEQDMHKKRVQNVLQGEAIPDIETGKELGQQTSLLTGEKVSPPLTMQFNKKAFGGTGDQVPTLSKPLKRNLKGQRKPQIRYQYTTVPGSSKPMKTAIVRKVSERKGPQDLIDLLMIQKQSMYDREMKMRRIQEQDLEDEALMKEEFDSEEEDEEVEDYHWYRDSDPQAYFTLCTKFKQIFKKGQQVYHCYGRRTNRYLLANYGFCLPHNKYNSMSFRVWLDFSKSTSDMQKEMQDRADRLANQETRSFRHPEGYNIENKEDEQNNNAPGEGDNKVSKVIKLKYGKLNEDMLAYLRMTLIQKKERELAEEAKENGEEKPQEEDLLLVSSPVDPMFELHVLAMGINLLEDLLRSRFKTQTLEADQELLKDQSISWRLRFGITHRLGLKKILLSNLHLLKVLAHLLAHVQTEAEGGKLRRDVYKKIYMATVESQEADKTPEEIFQVRLACRKYLRELMVNQKRVVDLMLKEATEAIKKASPEELGKAHMSNL